MLLACTLNASSRGFDSAGNEVVNVADADEVMSSASIESATLLGDADADCDDGEDDAGSGGLVDFLDDLVDDLLGGTGIALTAISSQCTADADGASGSSTLVGLGGGDDIVGDLLGDGLDLNELAADLGLTVGVDLGILELELDEQIEDSDGNGITVRALRLTLLPGDGGDEPLQEVILAESQCRFLGDDDDPDPDRGGDNDARNQSDISNTSDGTAVIGTGDADAVGNISNTEIDQAAAAAGAAFFGGATLDQDATVVNVGDAAANTGANTAIGNNSTNVATNDQVAVAVGDDSDGTNTAGNASSATNTSDGTAAVVTGDAGAVGNISDTEVDQAAGTAGTAGTAFFGGAGVDQDASVVNAGEAGANTGANTAIGNNSTNVATNDQVAVAVGDDSDGANTAGNASLASNESNGTAAVVTGDAGAMGNISDTEVDQTADAVGGTDPADCDDLDDVDCDCREDPWARWFGGGVCAFGGASSVDQSATVVNSGSASANTGGNTAIGNNSTNVVTNTQTAAAADD